MNQILISNMFRTSDGDDLRHSTGRSWDKALAKRQEDPWEGNVEGNFSEATAMPPLCYGYRK